MSTRRAIVLFAKNPIAAAVKTRLVPPLTHAEASALAAAFLEDSSANLLDVASTLAAKPCIFHDPPSARDAIRRLIPATVHVYPQGDGDLARRLSHAYDTLAREGVTEVCFIGADSPTLPRAYVAAAFAALAAGTDAVVGPASDGGYYLIGLRSAQPQLFERIDWSTSRVFAQTCERATEYGISLATLPEWYDVDDVVGLARLRAELFDSETPFVRGESAPRTKAYLVSLMASDRMPRATLK
jgi:rSAM/selenodomain-associated transferase 1